MINYLGMDVFSLNENEYISLISYEKNNIFWKEVYFNSDTEKKFVGSYFTEKGILDYNDYYIAIMTIDYDANNNPKFRIKRIFDINSRELIKGNSEDLLNFYENEFLKNEGHYKTRI